MAPEVRRAALEAALKTTRSHATTAARAAQTATLALGLAGGFLGGCALSHEAPRRAVTTMAATDVPAAPDAPTEDGGSDAPALSCDALLASLPLESTGWSNRFTNETDRNDPAVGRCCHAWELDVRDGRAEPVGWPPTPLAFACCDVVVFVQNLEPFSSLGCTPWGPPCPPEMPVA